MINMNIEQNANVEEISSPLLKKKMKHKNMKSAEKNDDGKKDQPYMMESPDKNHATQLVKKT